jgi:hypothetical protein
MSIYWQAAQFLCQARGPAKQRTSEPPGRVPGFETNPNIPITKIQNLLKPFEHLNFEIV